MRNDRLCACVALVLAGFSSGQQPVAKDKANEGKQYSGASAETKLKELLEAKVKAEWEAFKKKDKKAYSELLADDFVGIESDDQGTRSKTKAANEVEAGNVYNYSLFAFQVIPLG